ncbi:hypothetical protein [Mycobacteroides abscessus]|uniref:hypothetical protein n=1 Tax=Mycobacteroides abscessus TaxID=36809 RepID=UPI00105752EB|nr:hypothetical protein [Mycobacteroides abscessus]
MPGALDEFRAYIRNDISGYTTELITVDQLDDAERAKLPAAWLDILRHDEHETVQAAIQAWQRCMPDRFPEFLAGFAQNGFGVYLARSTRPEPEAAHTTLVYAFDNPDLYPARFHYRLGFLPNTDPELPEYWPNMPVELQAFYRELHDGFLDEIGAAPGGLERVANFWPLGNEGPDPADVIYIGRDSTGNKYELPEAQWPDLTKLIPVCRNRGRARILIDISRPAPEAAWEWWDGDLEAVPALWPDLDLWLVRIFDIRS